MQQKIDQRSVFGMETSLSAWSLNIWSFPVVLTAVDARKELLLLLDLTFAHKDRNLFYFC